MKLLTGEWLAAERENKALRDAKRKEFWAAVGVKPAKATSEIDLPPEARLTTMRTLADLVSNGKENDAELRRITTVAVEAMSAMSLGAFAHHSVGRAPDMAAAMPLRWAQRHFLINLESSPEYALNERRRDGG